MSQAAKRILLVGGASGGHAYPLVTIARALKEQAQQQGISLELLILGESEFIARAAQEYGIPFKYITAGRLRRYLSPLMILDAIKLPISFLQSLWHIFWFMPDAIFAKGSYDALAPSLVGKLYWIPLFIHESDSIPGLTNRILSRFAKTIFLAFPSAAQHFKNLPAVLAGNPTRMELLGRDRQAGLAAFQFQPDLKTILVLGGSQGAKQINDLILESLAILTKEYQIIHQTGAGQYDLVRKAVDQEEKEGKDGYGTLIAQRYRSYPFLNADQYASALAACDIIISRAGAGTLFEIAAAGKPAIVIPLIKGSRGEQRTNAAEFAKTGIVVMEGVNLTSHLLLNQIQNLLEPERYAQVSQNLKQLATPGAAQAIANAILS